MAYLLELDNVSRLQMSKIEVNNVKRRNQMNIKILNQLKKVLELSGVNIWLVQGNNFLQLYFTVKIQNDIDLLFQLRNTQHYQIKFCIRLLLRGNYARPRSSEITKNIIRTITYINSQNQKDLVYFTLNPKNGTFQLRSKIEINGYKTKELLRDAIKIILAESIKQVHSFSGSLLYAANLVYKYSVFNTTQESIKSDCYEKNGEPNKLGHVLQLLSLSTCQISTSIGEVINSKRRLANSLENAPKILSMFYKRSYPHDLKLYLQCGLLSNSHPIQKNLELNEFENMMSYPKIYKTCHQDNRVVFSTIRIIEQNSENESVIGEGGKAKLKRVRVKFAYGPSEHISEPSNKQQKQQQQQRDNQISAVLEKQLVLKVPKDGIPEYVKQRTLNQIIYQKCVLKNLRGAMCPYLPKYYQTEQRYCENRQALMMDYIPGPTLGEILPYTSSCFSLPSKLHLLMHLANALRFLESYDIAHLDISPNNIVIAMDGLPRIIDFGEAYHEKTLERMTPKKYYLPGRTFPYAPPETSQRYWGFSSAQDVYSFGVIAFKLLTGQFPLNCSGNIMQILYREKVYQQRILLVPEGVEWVGESDLIKVCMQLVLRCLHPNEYLRPHPPWLYIMLKKLYEAVI